MKIKTTSILVDDNDNEIVSGTMLALMVGKRNIVARYDKITSKGTIRLVNPITEEPFCVRLSSITGFTRCTFKMEG